MRMPPTLIGVLRGPLFGPLRGLLAGTALFS